MNSPKDKHEHCAGLSVAARRCEINELTKLSHTCDLVLVVNELIHCLQQERGISNVFLGSAGQLAAPLCTERIGASDAAHVTVRTWLEQAESTVGFSGGARLYTKIALALHALDELPGIRAAWPHSAAPRKRTRSTTSV